MKQKEAADLGWIILVVALIAGMLGIYHPHHDDTCTRDDGTVGTRVDNASGSWYCS